MEYGRATKEVNATHEAKVETPVAEILLDPARAAEIWPQEAAYPCFLDQIGQRKELVEQLDATLSSIPSPIMSLEAAAKTGFVTEVQLKKLYLGLSETLEDSDYARLSLYLPFEFLPSKSWVPADKSLGEALERFRGAYINAWGSLLQVHDVRANFVDGDVLEVEQRTFDLPRVVKAAHLIPKLVEHGMLEAGGAIDLLESSNDPLLKDNIADALMVLGDMGLLGESDLASMIESKDTLARNMAIIIESERKKSAVEIAQSIVTFDLIRNKLNEMLASLDTEEHDGLTDKRIAWLRAKKTQETVDTLAGQVSGALLKDSFSDDTAENILSYDGDSLAAQVLVGGILKAIESASLNNPESSQALYAKFEPVLLDIWQTGDIDTKKHLTKTFRRLHRLGLVNKAQLNSLGISLPNLAGPLSENLNLIPSEVERLKSVALSIESDPELSSLVHPVVLVYGSKIKGYGEAGADTDMAVFVKPGTPFAEQDRLRALLGNAAGDDVAEFWLDKHRDGLKVHDFRDTDILHAESHWTYVLFGAAWVGDNSAIDELRKKVLSAYFYDDGQQIYDHSARRVYLEEIERDALQYRLMHKGYERHYPSYGSVKSAHSGLIDGDSAFWDSGYRQLATKLFASKVFLPKIPR